MNKNILLINFGGIGDEILFLPVVDSVKKLYPDSSITLALEPRSAGIKSLSPHINELIFCDIKSKNKYLELLKLIFTARGRKFDIAISSGGSPFISIILFLTGIKKRYGYDCGALSRKLLTKAVPLNKKQYAGRMYHDLLRGIDENVEFNLPEIDLAEEYVEKAKELLLKNGNKNVLIHPGVSLMSVQKEIYKSFEADKWCEIIELLKKQGYNVYLAGGPDDNEIIKNITAKVECINLFGKTKNLLELAGLMKASDAVVCVDSAPMHVGVCVMAKLVAIFAGTDEKKLIPEHKNFLTVTNSKLECRPCLWDKRGYSCEDLTCLEIDSQQIIDAVKKQVESI